MDAVFFLDVETRSLFLRSIAQTTGCRYVCLWSYAPLVPEHLFCIDGWCNDEGNQPSSSSGSAVQILFNEYRQTQYAMDNSFNVPGHALKGGVPYLELSELELLRRTSNATQRRFYQQAQIKSAVFLSCASGEIEIGMSTSPPVNMKMEINSWFQLQSQFKASDQDWQSSSSSSLRSLSVGSPDSSPHFYTMPTSTTFSRTPVLPTEAYNSLRIHNFNSESDNAEITRAMLAVISSPSSSASSQGQTSQKSGAFKDYTSALAPNSPMKPNLGKQNMLKRSISIMRNIQLNMRDELTEDIPRTSSSQLHHKISERKRREKLNESFQELRSLLPPGSKKDKASVLSNTLEYLSNLKIEVMDLKKKNDILEGRALNVEGAGEQAVGVPSGEKIHVQVILAPESTSEDQGIQVQVTVRGDCNTIDLILDILGYLKLVNEVTLLSMDADTRLIETKPINQINFRMKIKKGEWDQAAFEEAMNRIVTNVGLTRCSS